MPSANKTSHLGLNNWCGSDKPKREDFVQDNLLIDAAFHNHASDSDLHFLPQDRDRLNNLISTGFYVGTGDPEHPLALPFSPSFVLVFRVASLPANGSDVFFGAASQQFASAGISLKGSSLTVSETSKNGGFVHLNQSGITYLYFMVR